MELNRRIFLKLCGLVPLLLAGGRLLSEMFPMIVIKALKGKKYPGDMKPLDEKEILQPAKWQG